MDRLHTLHRRHPGQDAHILTRALREPDINYPDGTCDHLELLGLPHYDMKWEWLLSTRGAWYLAIVRGWRNRSRYTNPLYNHRSYSLSWTPVGHHGTPRVSDHASAVAAATTAAQLSNDRDDTNGPDYEWEDNAAFAGAAHGVDGSALIYLRDTEEHATDSEVVVVWGPDRPWAIPFPERVRRRWDTGEPF